MAGTRYDYLLQDQELDIYIVKVDSVGLITGIEDPIQSGCHDAIVYPNPGSDYLIIQSGPQISGADFCLVDMQGNMVLETTLDQTLYQISTAHLLPGPYVWSITHRNRIIENGKWVLTRQ